MRPPPGPGVGPPGDGVFGPVGSLQHAAESADEPVASASSNVMTSIPLSLNAGAFVIFGIHARSHASALFNPPGRPSTHGASWPSLQRFGVMNAKFGVRAGSARSA